MPVRSRTTTARLSTAALAALLLSACIPPFWPPVWFPGFGGFGEQSLIIENATDEDWILRVTSDWPTDYAVPAGETGEANLYGLETTSVTLLDRDCQALTEIEWEDGFIGVRISGPAALNGFESAQDEERPTFAEYYECSGFGGGAPEAGDALAGATGSILVSGGDASTWLLDVATAELTAVSEAGDSFSGEYTWAPDGEQIAFSRMSMTSAASDVFVMNADGSDERLLIEEASTPIWSPDGTRIAYLNLDPFAGSSAVSVHDLATGESVDLEAEGNFLAWSPDGTQIAYVTGDFMTVDPFGTPSAELRLINPDGTGDRLLADAAPFAGTPAWSPDGSTIAFMVASDGGDAFAQPSDIGLYDLQTDAVRTISAPDGASLAEPTWSPDGSRLAVTVSTATMFSSSGSLGIAPASGGEVELIGTLDDAWYAYPLWSPDGEWIAVSRSTMTSFDGELVAFRPDGTDETVLATGVLTATAWRPD